MSTINLLRERTRARGKLADNNRNHYCAYINDGYLLHYNRDLTDTELLQLKQMTNINAVT
jgi:hypothetical protein